MCYVVNVGETHLYHCWNNTRYQRNYSVQSYPFYRCFALRLHNDAGQCIAQIRSLSPLHSIALSVCVWTINCWLNLSASSFFHTDGVVATFFSCATLQNAQVHYYFVCFVHYVNRRKYMWAAADVNAKIKPKTKLDINLLAKMKSRPRTGFLWDIVQVLFAAHCVCVCGHKSRKNFRENRTRCQTLANDPNPIILTNQPNEP